MANPVFDPEKTLGIKITKMDRTELCEFISALCRGVVAQVGSRGRHGGIYPENISVDENGGIAVGPAGKSPWEGQELQFVAPELYWNGTLSAASDVYSVGMLMYYAVSGGKLPLEDECEDAQLRRMGGGDLPAPKKAGRSLGEIIEKCIRFRAAERYQTLEELRAVLDSCVKNLYLSGIPSAEAIFKKDDDSLNDIERMMVGIMEKSEEDPAEEEEPEEDIPEECVKVYNPAPKTEQKELLTQEQSEMFARRFTAQGSPAAPKYIDEEGDLEPVFIGKRADSVPEEKYARGSERERKIAEEVKKRRRRPLAVILVLCAVLVMVAIVMNAMLRDFQEAKNQPDNVIETISVDPYSVTMPPVETPVSTGAIGIEDLELNEDGIPTAGHDETKDPILSTTEGEEKGPVEHGYQVFKADISWTDAQKACAALGGHLVVISDEAEYDEILRLAEDAGITRIWIGCHRINGVDTWETDEPGYINWAKGEPTYVDRNDQVSEDYFMLWNNNGWACNDNRDDPCKDYPDFYSGTMGYICEFGD